jgi:hypothetical protein
VPIHNHLYTVDVGLLDREPTNAEPEKHSRMFWCKTTSLVRPSGSLHLTDPTRFFLESHIRDGSGGL